MGWTAMKFCTDIHIAQRINPTYFSVPLGFPYYKHNVLICGSECNVLATTEELL